MIAAVWQKKAAFLGIFLLLVCVLLLSLAVGQADIPAGALLRALSEPLGLSGEAASLTEEQQAVLYHIRLPRMLVGALVGAALGAVISIALGLTASGLYFMPLYALAGALCSVALTVLLSMRGGKIPVMVLLLAGVVVSILLGALTSGILTFMNEYKLREFLFWTVGGLDYRRWEHVWLAAGPVLCGVVILLALARHLNVLVLGEEEVRAVGAPVL